jgi:hypothetical protein
MSMSEWNAGKSRLNEKQIKSRRSEGKTKARLKGIYRQGVWRIGDARGSVWDWEEIGGWQGEWDKYGTN